MFNWRTPRDKTGLEKARETALLVLDDLDPMDPDYATTMKHVKKLSELIANERRELLNPNTVILALANVGGIIMIVGYERIHIVTSKALTLIGKTSKTS
jgi:hypothetical protein